MHLDAITKQVGVMTTMEVPQQFRMEGWVYVLSNPCMPGIYKVGMTTTSPEVRARELSSATGVPAPFKIEAAFYTHTPLEAEKEVHEALSEWRVNDSREFFELPVEEIIHACSQSCEAQVGENVESIAVYNDFITFETLGKLNVNTLFNDIGISVFGDKLAAAERLIRIGADTVLNIRKKHGVVIAMHDSNAYAIEPADEQELRKHREEYESFRAKCESQGIYGPTQPVEF
ncbi:GIY-YIG nuclease family protein [Klebsiella michiganensis]|uniref:GIY-YIG nuclease family protein n=1 Tax=Klebsiella TaxID=570 RepID=UPI0015A729BC|nr:GIY-YIG nuclease family protein [Klebsiella michiganensis]HCJ1550861.1 GIY-YIG nuclease family protein [Klebsiella pneumoniae]MDL5430506.1 GIY-YIG nuclease family protein [Klebsiella michiganensis]MEB6467696.1 GIY-YIG nuclease family protein [Klebsiella michiganensis]HBK4618629.1 GIY-YIG nuclease family protein [Klebsiella michiganensis]HCJ2550825.1 GIY-YIG nuclease family protein [Klebsiella pneumoniae]